jgi:hypothetical protein
VHTSDELTSDAFEIRIDGQQMALIDVLPGFDVHDRLGIVIRDAGGAVGASALILAAITAFYDEQRRRSRDFFVYPDYFCFHVGARFGDHGMLDIWPGHKEVVVADDAEEILRAVNDRGITRLLVPEGTPGEPELERQTLASAVGRIVTALVYSPSGRVAEGDVTVAGTGVTERYVAAVLEQSAFGPGRLAEIEAGRSGLLDGGRPVETYRRISVEHALGLLQRMKSPPLTSSVAPVT